MVIWIIFAVVTTATTAALLHPLTSSSRLRPADAPAEVSRVYRDQLLELERELRAGEIAQVEYEYALAETARRLFKANEEKLAPAPTPQRGYRWLKLGIVLLLPLLSIGVYVGLGSPDLPSQPLQARLQNPGHDLAMLVKKTEVHLARHPDDGRGWDVIAPVFLRMGRAEDAEKAYRQAIQLLGASVQRLDGLAEAVMAKSDGSVNEDVRTVLQQLLRLEPANPRARFYIALGLEQAGKGAEARTAFEELAKDSPADAPWLPLVNRHIAANGGVAAAASTLSGVAQADIPEKAAKSDQQKFVVAMVSGLDAELAANPDNLDGWLRLIRSYVVLDEKMQAAAALKRGLAAFPAGSEKGKELVGLGRELGVDMEG